jgi:hypothetical protein
VEAALRAGNPEVQGLCLALSDWSAELKILEALPWKTRWVDFFSPPQRLSRGGLAVTSVHPIARPIAPEQGSRQLMRLAAVRLRVGVSRSASGRSPRSSAGILRSVLEIALLVNEDLLSQEADGVCDSNPIRDPIGLEVDRPWVLQKEIDVPQLLRGDTSDFHRGFSLVVAIVFTAD